MNANGDAAGQTPAGPTLNVYSDYGWLRGFSVVASWGARIEQAWWAYDAGQFREEVALARLVHANCIRLWIDFSAWMVDPDLITECFLDAVAAIDEAGMKAMPCLSNRWHDVRYDYGGTYTECLYRDPAPRMEYVAALVTPLIDDDRVLIWDLCNEPQAHDLDADVNQKEYAWLAAMAATVRECGAQQPITIGTSDAGNIETFAPLMDVLCAHPYAHNRESLEQLISGYTAVRQKHAKPMLVNETIPGSLDDARRGECARYHTEMLSEAGVGWMGWALREGMAISTRRDRIDRNGLDDEGFHPFFTRDGKLRDGLEFMTQEPARPAPWNNSG